MINQTEKYELITEFLNWCDKKNIALSHTDWYDFCGLDDGEEKSLIWEFLDKDD